MSGLKFSEDHDWVLAEGGSATVGITDHAQEQLGDIVFVELPEVGAEFAKGDQVAVVESVKAASEIYSPLSGTVAEVNEVLNEAPETVNGDATGAGWLFKITLSDAAELDDLLDETAYKAIVGED